MKQIQTILKSMNTKHYPFVLALLFSILTSCQKEEKYDTFEFVEKHEQGIFKMDISKADVIDQYGDKDWLMLSESELNDYFQRLKGINFRKLDANTLLIDNYNFSQEVELVKLDAGYYFGLIYELPGDEENYISPVMITMFGTITGNRVSATFSSSAYYYNVGQYQESVFHANYVFETTLNWIDSKQWEPAGPQITRIDDLGKGRGIRIYFKAYLEDIVPVKEFRIYRINDITASLNYQHIGTLTTNDYGAYLFDDITDWALNAGDLETPGYLVTAVGQNQIESFLTQQAFRGLLLHR